MPYLSRIPLNPMRRRSQALLSSPQLIHAEILNALPTQPVRERTLWRREVVQDAQGTQRRVNLIVLSQTQPSWAEVVVQYGWPGTEEGEALVRDYEPLLARVQLGRELAFKVTANPSSVTHKPESLSSPQEIQLSKGRGVRVGHRSAPHQLDWFLQRADTESAAWGFTVGERGMPSVLLVGRERLRFRKRREGPWVTLDTATFEGVLRVTDVARFREVLLDGLGRGKAYGCGLLTVARPGGRRVVAG
jgi:CRISPR system Cascade subunit CasE